MIDMELEPEEIAIELQAESTPEMLIEILTEAYFLMNIKDRLKFREDIG